MEMAVQGYVVKRNDVGLGFVNWQLPWASSQSIRQVLHDTEYLH